MSRKSQRNVASTAQARVAAPVPVAAPPERAGRTAAIAIAAVTLIIAAALAAKLIGNRGPAPEAQAARAAALASLDAPTVGAADARVHIVEFIDPACETCALFYPEVKKLMAEHPGRIRLSIRHVAFHKDADVAVRVLEAALAQGKYFQALEALLSQQPAWVANHRVLPDRVSLAVAPAGLDAARLAAEMASPEVDRRIQRDRADAATLGVSQTPEYFVNGRQMPNFGLDELRALVRDEVARSYR